MSGKNRGKSGNFKVDDKWQPCIIGECVGKLVFNIPPAHRS